MKYVIFILTILIPSQLLIAQSAQKQILQELDKKSASYATVAQQIWQHAEVGYQEEKKFSLTAKTTRGSRIPS